VSERDAAARLTTVQAEMLPIILHLQEWNPAFLRVLSEGGMIGERERTEKSAGTRTRSASCLHICEEEAGSTRTRRTYSRPDQQ
jgi:hypothetical protein